MSYEHYQLMIIAQDYFPSFSAMAITNHSKYTTSTLAVLSALAFKPKVDWLCTARRQAYTEFIASLVIQDTAFHAVHSWAGVVG